MKSSIQSVAKQAKSRIKSGYWSQVKNEKIAIMQEIEQVDNEMYEVVASIIESDEVVLNPISKLMDENYYKSLSDDGKNRYVLELANKYLKLCREYERRNKKLVNVGWFQFYLNTFD